MNREWRRPVYPIASFLFAVIILTCLGAPLFIDKIRFTLSIYLTALLIGFAAISILFILTMIFRDIWFSQSRTTTAKPEDLVRLLEEALKEAGLEPILRNKKAPRPIWKTIDLRGRLNLSITEPGTLLASGLFFELYVGPVRIDTKKDVEYIENVIDKALESIEK